MKVINDSAYKITYRLIFACVKAMLNPPVLPTER